MPAPQHTSNLRRMYLRRRVAAALVVIGAPVALAVRATNADASRDAAPSAHYVVQPGDTMWSIAQHLAHDGSIASYVDALVTANGGASLAVGQLIVVPG